MFNVITFHSWTKQVILGDFCDVRTTCSVKVSQNFPAAFCELDMKSISISDRIITRKRVLLTKEKCNWNKQTIQTFFLVWSNKKESGVSICGSIPQQLLHLLKLFLRMMFKIQKKGTLHMRSSFIIAQYKNELLIKGTRWQSCLTDGVFKAVILV